MYYISKRIYAAKFKDIYQDVYIYIVKNVLLFM